MAKFENDIENRLGGFKLQPSAHVWEGVEASLHEKKKRRYAIWWWMPVAGLFLLGFGWWAMMGNEEQQGKELADTNAVNKKEVLAENEKKEPVEQTPSIKTNGQEKELGAAKNLALNNEDEKAGNGNNISASLETKKKTTNANTASNKKERTGIAVKKAAISSTSKANEITATTVTSKQHEVEISKSSIAANHQEENSKAVKETSTSKTTVATKDTLVKVDSIALAKTSQTITKDSLPTKHSSTTSIAKNKQKNSWHFVTGGGSSLVKGSNFFNNIFSGDEKSANPSNFQTGSVGSGPTSGVGSGSSNANYPLPNTGFSFIIGAGHEWNLNKRWQLNAGLQYRYVQNRQQLSMMGLGNFSGASALPSQVNNNSHWLQLPLGISYTINPNSSNKFQLLAGGSVIIPISQEWVVTPATGGYYYDKSMNSKLLANLHTGIAMQTKADYRFSLMAEQSITSIHKNNSNKYYWQQYSIQLQLPFSKILKPKP